MNHNERMLVEANLERRHAHRRRLQQEVRSYAPQSARDIPSQQLSDSQHKRTLNAHSVMNTHISPDEHSRHEYPANVQRSSLIAEDSSFSHQQHHNQSAQNHPHAVMDSTGHFHKEHPSFLKSCRHALDGFVVCFTTERNFKVMVAIAILAQIVCIATPWIDTLLYLMVTAYSALMLALELINTALESVVDLVSPQYHPLAKRAKDMVAAAVWFFAVVCIHLTIVGFVMPLLRHLTGNL